MTHSAPDRYTAYLRDLQTRNWAYAWTPSFPTPHLAGRTRDERRSMIAHRRAPLVAPPPAKEEEWTEA
jgi:hypothetical protein